MLHYLQQPLACRSDPGINNYLSELKGSENKLMLLPLCSTTYNVRLMNVCHVPHQVAYQKM